MAQTSSLYAVARLKMLRRRFLSAAQTQRLIAADGSAEALKVLAESGYLSGDSRDWEAVSLRRTLEASELIKKLSPDSATSDAFLLRYDAHNLKVLFKARILGIEPEGITTAGTLNPELLRHAVAEHRYTKLPQALAATMDRLEKLVITTVDPMAIDVIIDQALYQMMAQMLKKSSSPAARGWLRLKADGINLVSYIRLRHMAATLPYAEVLVPGGAISAQDLQAAAHEPERLLKLYDKVYGGQLVALARKALEDTRQTAALERAIEARLLASFDHTALDIEGMDSVIAYLVALEKENTALRLIMAGKRAGLSPEQIEERLRGQHG